ncbi:MAG TPA: hypothetical protein VF183_09525 [Acidimicrobiales bacterium]
MSGRRSVVAALLVALVLAGCGDDDRSPGGAKTCEQLVERAVPVAQELAERFAGVSVDQLDPGTPERPFPELTEPFEPFRARAEELGCDEGELRRIACDAYQGIEPTGPAIEELLAAIETTCP